MEHLSLPTMIDYLPSYTPSDPAPIYSCEPSEDEQRLQHNPRSSTATHHTGTFIKKSKSGKVTICLTEQEEGTTIPRYDHQGPVGGSIAFEDREAIVEVVAKLEGTLDTTSSEAGSRATSLVSDRYVLWSKNSREPSSSVCPAQIPFALLLPSKRRDSETENLPPTFEVHSPGANMLFVRSSYRVTFIITRSVHLWTRKKTIRIPFIFIHRNRPHRPIYPRPCLFSSVKTSPEEWFQAVGTVAPRHTSSLEPISGHIFVPAGRVYGIKDTIPFHIQLAGRVSSLRELFSGTNALDRISSADTAITSLKKPPTASLDRPTIHVQILRQVTVVVRGQKSWRNFTIGEGKLTAVPPPLMAMANINQMSTDDPEAHLDWEGEIRCDEDVKVGGFSVANAQVKEFLQLQVLPPAPARSQLLDLQLSIPIRFVTDSHVDRHHMDLGA